MKKLLLILCFLIVSMYPAMAANTTPPCVDGTIITNKNGQYGCYFVGNGLSVVTSGSNLYLTSTGGSGPPSDSITTETGDPIVTETGDFIVTE